MALSCVPRHYHCLVNRKNNLNSTKSRIHVLISAKSRQSCPTLCNPIDSSPSGSPVLGILQARTLEWVAISFSNAWKWEVKVKSLSRVRLWATPWTASYQAPPSMGFSRQEYWSGVPLHSPESRLVMSNSLQLYGLYSPWNSPGQNIGVSSHSLLREIFPTQDQTQVSHIAGGFFTSWATREAQEYWSG